MLDLNIPVLLVGDLNIPVLLAGDLNIPVLLAGDLNIPVLLAGDFNIDMMGNQCTPLKNLLTRLNLTNVVGEPTRITPSSATCIDLLVTNRPNLILNVAVSSNFCSDHCPVQLLM